MHKLAVLLFITTLIGCSAAGVIYTNDPHQKVSNSYAMMSQGRAIPAEKFAKEAYEQFKESNDIFGQGESLVALGLLYKSNLMQKHQSAVDNFQQAIVLFKSINDYSSQAKTKFALGNAYAGLNKKDEQCAMYSESIKDYKKSKEINPKAAFQFNPAYSSFDAMVKDFQKGYCE